ncbi:Imm52 family immunity protein [Methylocystis heyeri]|nr:Imm52 family immunity protein [Methylocystis heyeri]
MTHPIGIEIEDESKDFFIGADWEARAETPEALAARFLRMIDSLKEIDPVFSLWTCGTQRPENLEEARDRYAAEIAAGIMRDDWKEPIPEMGYLFGAFTRNTPEARAFDVTCRAGSYVKEVFGNSVTLSTDVEIGSRPDADVVSHRIFRAALLAVVDAWDPVMANATSHPLVEATESDSYFAPAWIQYLCPWLAEKITPPSTVLAERLPNGGLLMSATTETFDVDNPAHMAAARDMAKAMAPLDRLPWPSKG